MYEDVDDPLEPVKDLTGDSTILMAVAGAVVSVFASFLPLSPLFGGMLAGYLSRGVDESGLRVGAISGLIASVPVFVVLALAVGLAGVGAIAGEFAGAALAFAFVSFFVVASVLYTIGVSAAGGYIGVYLFEEYVLEDEEVLESDVAE